MEIHEIIDVKPDMNSGATLETFSGTLRFRGTLFPDTPEDIHSFGLAQGDLATPVDKMHKPLRTCREAMREWQDAGNPLPRWVPPTAAQLREVAFPLTARQFRLGLVRTGRTLAEVDEAIAAITDPVAKANAEIEWQYAPSFKRTHPLVLTLAAALGFTPEEVDTLWEEALKL